MEWNDETIGRLRTLWDEGLSTAEIGRRLGVSKNAVVGKAHRMTLPARPSPIRRDGSGPARPAAPRRVTGPTLPPLPASCVETPGIRPAAPPIAARNPDPASPSVRASVAAAPTGASDASPRIEMAALSGTDAAELSPIRVVPAASGRHSACCWPLGEPGTRSFRFCDATSLPGKPYCGEHAQIAYVKVRDRREEAA